MTKQEIFDIVKIGLLQQNAKSYSSTGSCAYSGTNGKRCAIGLLIPPAHPGMNFRSGVTDLVLEYVDLQDVMIATDLERTQAFKFLNQLQYLHDAEKVQHWPRRLSSFATRWSLEA